MAAAEDEEDLGGWARSAFRPGRLSGPSPAELRRRAYARGAEAKGGLSPAVMLIGGAGIFGGAVLAGVLFGRWLKRRRAERAQAQSRPPFFAERAEDA